MNNVDPDWQFRMEIMPDFSSNQIPTLDFTLWLEEARVEPGECPWILYHTFYMKEISSKYFELETSARASTSKASSLAQENATCLRRPQPVYQATGAGGLHRQDGRLRLFKGTSETLYNGWTNYV